MLIAASGLGHRFAKSDYLFRNLDFELDENSMVGISGPSGSGKSTLMAIMASWVAPSEGRVTRHPEMTVSWIPQHPIGVHQRLTIDHLTLPLLARGIPRAEATSTAIDALARFDLADEAGKRFGALSGGEAQRLMLARAALTAARVVLVDEPTAQLDPVSSARIVSILAQLAGQRRLVVVASHDPDALEVCPQRIRLGPT